MLLSERRTESSIFCLLAAGAITLGALAASSGAQPEMEAAAPAPNPHWRRDACHHCHADPDADELAIPGERVTAVCMNCHDGHKAPMERHPVGRSAKSARASAPADWPTPGGKLSCITCHDPLLSGEHSSLDRGANPEFLRGAGRGPSADLAEADAARSEISDSRSSIRSEISDFRFEMKGSWRASSASRLTEFCGNCHAPKDHQRLNPHRVFAEDGNLVADRCGFCHLKSEISNLRSASAAPGFERKGQPHLLTDEVTLCAACHGRHADFFEPGHIRRKVPATMLAHWHAAGGASTATLPLTHGDTVTCSTCHNPHYEGVFPKNSAMSQGAGLFHPADDDIALRVAPAALCSTCHFP